jgi:predicted DNA-binding transcriptional regulator YafY
VRSRDEDDRPHPGSGYGIFSDSKPRQATLRFTAERARRVAKERWHADEKGRLLRDGRYELRIPYHDDPELLMDIFKYGADCEVVGPEALKARVEEEILWMAASVEATSKSRSLTS